MHANNFPTNFDRGHPKKIPYRRNRPVSRHEKLTETNPCLDPVNLSEFCWEPDVDSSIVAKSKKPPFGFLCPSLDTECPIDGGIAAFYIV